jgi:folate-binding protein YgfZ
MPHIADSSRTILAIHGEDRISFLQGILTQDVSKLADDGIQFAAVLSPQGKILHDMFLIADGERILIDTPARYAETLLKRLAMYKLRAKVAIENISTAYGVGYGEHGLADPRHAALPKRHYALPTGTEDGSATMHRATLALGIPDSAIDFAPDDVVALDAGYDLLNAVSFTKGCYVGQEVTARMHYKNIARRGFYILTSDLMPTRLALLKFEAVAATGGVVTVDNIAYHATLPAWMQPKRAQFEQGANNQ